MISLSVIALVELFVVWALVNRLLLQAAIRPIQPFATLTHTVNLSPTNGAAVIEPARAVKKFSLPINS
jgi:hypothetical protein